MAGQTTLVPPVRIRQLSASRDLNARGDLVLYWMIAHRRRRYNFALQHAVHHAQRLKKPLVVLEALRCGYRWASDRLHRFVMQGMAANLQDFAKSCVCYYPYLEPAADHGKGLLQTLAEKACLVVTDEFPCFFLPAMVRRAAEVLPVRLESVDSNGVLPLRAADKVFPTAYAFRRFLQKTLPEHLPQAPEADSLASVKLPRIQIDPAILARWPMADKKLLAAGDAALAKLPIDHEVQPALLEGGAHAAATRLEQFLQEPFARYGDDRNHPDHDASSGLSPYLHFGHISAHEVLHRIAEREDWTPKNVSSARHGKRNGWWGMSEHAESFLDELITWRELGYNMCSLRSDYDQYDSLPEWARTSLQKHATDLRDPVYELEHFEAAQTHDPVWNAAQRQLIRDGRMHNYLRMLWGKKILHWSPSPREALETMIHLNNKYAVDGRNPNSYSGIFWCLGRYDRAWGPERPIFGKIRYMTSDSTLRKLKMKEYMNRYGGESDQKRLF